MARLSPDRYPLRLWSDVRTRRIAYAVLALILALLCLFPQPHVTRAKILPQDNSNGGIGSILNSLGGQLPTLGALIGNRQSIDLYLSIARSEDVRGDVIKALSLVGPGGAYSTDRAARVALDKKVDVHSLTGGIIEIETLSHDSDEAMRLTQAYVGAISGRIKALGHLQVINKRKIVQNRFTEASRRVATTEAALNAFRSRNRVLADPEAQLGSALTIRAGLEAQLKARIVALETLQHFSGPDNPQLRAMQSEIASLQRQVAGTIKPASEAGGPNAAALTDLSTEYLNLYRDYRFAQVLFEVYSRFSEQVAVEELVSSAASDVQIIETPNEDAARHFNVSAVAALLALVLAALFTEIYAPATGIILPGSRPSEGS